MRRLLLILSFLLLVQGIIAEQDGRNPWPPDPEVLFAEGVDVQAVERLEFKQRSFADNEKRIVRVYDETTDEWREYSYPEETEGHLVLTQRSDGAFLLASYSPRADWMIDPAEDTITPLELVCGEQTPALPGEGEWYYVVGDNTESIYLCFSETDERILLPEELSNVADFDLAPEPAISPDGRWLVAITHESQPISNTQQDYYEVYSYEIASGRLNYLGRINHKTGSYPPVISRDWVSDSSGLISHGPPQESLSKGYYRFDVIQPDSLELIAEGWMYDFYRDPPRYEYVETTGFLSWKAGSYFVRDCSFLRYDVQGVQRHELGYDCIGADVSAGIDRLTTLRVDSDPAEFSTLISYDLNTREFTEIVSGEIEWRFGGIYPYILLLMDDSGQIDLVNSYPMYGGIIDITEFWWLGDIEGAYVAVLDRTTGEFVYDSRSTQRVSSDGAVFAEWVAGDRFVYSLNWGEPSMTLVVLDDDGADEYTVEGVYPDYLAGLRFSPNRYRLFVTMPQEGTIGIADFLSGEAFPLLKSGITASYAAFYFKWIDDNTLSVTVSHYDYSGAASAVYTVRIP